MDKRILPPDLARAIAACRRRIKHTCRICSADFEGLKQRQYCSAACRQRAHYMRNERKRHERAKGSEVPALVERLNRTRAAIMHGRHFDVDSVQLLDEVRDRYVADP